MSKVHVLCTNATFLYNLRYYSLQFVLGVALGKVTRGKTLKFSVAVIVACHNRSALTFRALSSLKVAAPSNWELRVYLVDDGSSDGTVSNIKGVDLDLKVTTGPGNWYWAKSMFKAECSIDKSHDAILWMNDDVELFKDSLTHFETTRIARPGSILVGQFLDQTKNQIGYGGLLKDGIRPQRFLLKFFDANLNAVDTFHGNLVLIPSGVSEKVGTIDGGFAHAYSDIDFGLRARKLGIEIIVVPGFSGTCLTNQKNNLKLWKRLKAIESPKGQPIKSQIRYLRRHGPWFWPLFLLSPYVRAVLGKQAG